MQRNNIYKLKIWHYQYRRSQTLAQTVSQFKKLAPYIKLKSITKYNAKIDEPLPQPIFVLFTPPPNFEVEGNLIYKNTYPKSPVIKNLPSSTLAEKRILLSHIFHILRQNWKNHKIKQEQLFFFLQNQLKIVNNATSKGF